VLSYNSGIANFVRHNQGGVAENFHKMALIKYAGKFLLHFFIVFVMLLLGSLLDIFLAAIGEFFGTYSYALFIVIFGVAGIFAAAATLSPPDYFKKNPVPLWVALLYNIIIGLLYYFPFALLEGGEYQPAFRSLGVMLVAGSLFFYYLYKKEKENPAS